MLFELLLSKALFMILILLHNRVSFICSFILLISFLSLFRFVLTISSMLFCSSFLFSWPIIFLSISMLSWLFAWTIISLLSFLGLGKTINFPNLLSFNIWSSFSFCKSQLKGSIYFSKEEDLSKFFCFLNIFCFL